MSVQVSEGVEAQKFKLLQPYRLVCIYAPTTSDVQVPARLLWWLRPLPESIYIRIRSIATFVSSLKLSKSLPRVCYAIRVKAGEGQAIEYDSNNDGHDVSVDFWTRKER